MIKETIVKDDGRLLTFYSFADKKDEGTADDSKKAGEPCCCGDAHKADGDKS
jgi:hypothetical protein